ncbi:hypothetical protein T458_11455 [Brevibacillus panacihumi W25]|uniref:Uncharacterized protein n=1 Tax=Brevibacillus panacihumi W25 TaxID=1408254 RepID=V6M7K7_9BACL|nr:hypothetical protein T458_11455 [Brevibacillus panacihumi W25]
MEYVGGVLVKKDRKSRVPQIGNGGTKFLG